MNTTCSFLVSVLLCVGYVCSRKFPPYLTVCHRNDPNLEACFRKAVEQLRPHFADGIPEMLIPPMDPLFLPQAGLDSGDNFKASFKNIKLHHTNEFKIDRLAVDLDKLRIELEVSFPRLRVQSEYNVDGRILFVQLQGQGPADGNLTNVMAKVSIDGKRYTKKGKEYMSIGSHKMDLELGKPTFLFENIFQDNKELNDQTNKIINDNIVDILEELKPVIDKTVIEFTFGIVGRIFSRFSFDELFPK